MFLHCQYPRSRLAGYVLLLVLRRLAGNSVTPFSTTDAVNRVVRHKNCKTSSPTQTSSSRRPPARTDAHVIAGLPSLMSGLTTDGRESVVSHLLPTSSNRTDTRVKSPYFRTLTPWCHGCSYPLTRGGTRLWSPESPFTPSLHTFT